MEKLIELLNEYIEKNINTPNRCIWYSCLYFWFDGWTDVIEDTIISKRYWFIKWLVDNDKIDHKIYEDMKFTAIKQWVLIDKKSGSTAQETREIIKNGCIDTFIALLAISDTPIQDLCVWLR